MQPPDYILNGQNSTKDKRMITRIEIDGFKTFQDFAVDLAPFQVIIGANGCGKSNLLDAIGFLSLLATEDLDTAFQKVRGQTHELFTLLPNGQLTNRMHFTVDLLVNTIVLGERKVVEDSWGDQVTLTSPRLRYKIGIGRETNEYGLPQLHVLSESLEPISRESDFWLERFAGSAFTTWLYSARPLQANFINTTSDKLGNPTVYLLPDRDDYRVHHPYQQGFQTGKMRRTMLSRVETVDYAHALAARYEIQHWRNFALNPELLRLPSSLSGTSNYFAENNLPAVMARMRFEDEELIKCVYKDLSKMAPDITSVGIDFNQARQTIELFAITKDGRQFYMPNLSDGTVRLLALAILKNDPQHHGVVCLEEPENGVHPGILRRLVCMLREITSDFSDPLQSDHLKQLIVTTHSPEMVSHLDVNAGELLYAEMVTRMQPGQMPMQVTRMTPVGQEVEGDKAARSYTLNQVFKYLKNADYQAIRGELQKAGV